ncbi:hypothetical protein PFICI_12434 [Pestalotiopsis fici W106-1]|uniref:Zn(2)-C6 fungal-type domain-containing protein n=1 Tax=Pestalotiopsis fici (strain W106-1 / CGMCC3.15140) TaxID=1229662 RepID=W3WNK0_PESFW|nr:uncharacterized protein PFICI_12434 [Pestalotiopsis fici W106-1]ETS75490.1 hypothetical protein PFICI_12434 [Pestalotiopsis fici W106-1]
MSSPNLTQPPGQGVSSVLPVKRRPACERCRSQKLKCLRDEGNSAGACLRCVDSGVRCVTNRHRRPGRPARSCGEDQQASSTRTDEYSGNVSALSTVVDDVSWTMMDDITLDSIMSYANGTTTVYHDTGQYLDTFGFEDGQELYDQMSSHTGVTADYGASGSNQSYSEDLECELLQLQQQLTKLIIDLRTRGWNVTTSLTIKPQTVDHDIYKQSHTDGPGFNPIAETLGMVSELDKILNKIMNNVFPRESFATINTCSWVRSQYVLSSLACYMRIISAYDYIVSHILDEYSKNPVAREFILNGAPKLAIAGFAVPSPKNLLGQLLAQTLEQKLSPIESTLGLPYLYRVVPEMEDYHNRKGGRLLKETDGKLLLDTLENISSGSMMSSTEPSGVQALKDKLDRLKSLGLS